MDSLMARLDLQEMGIRREFHPTNCAPNRTYLPSACYTMVANEKNQFCKALKGLGPMPSTLWSKKPTRFTWQQMAFDVKKQVDEKVQMMNEEMKELKSQMAIVISIL
ncbi:hypothetical protein CFOL_v3_26003 [Cephalotus follicularis]|uniref:Uncharacterized protein n=1 Tax=Cephalotus follicularis TaxID=3775 RepID=A0A1Q3CQY4_CEPFO|nr:hypothetical protein CFOL_v3_26003 [Cephalotus follicularis]